MNRIVALLQRWSRRKLLSQARDNIVHPAAELAGAGADTAPAADILPEQQRRRALRALFMTEHHNTMDMLDVYVSDYSCPELLPANLLEGLEHARALLARPVGEKAGERVTEAKSS